VFAARARLYAGLLAALSFIGIVNYSVLAWTPSMFERRYGWAPQEIGPLFGVILAVLGPVGTAFGGYLIDKRRAMPSDRMAMRLCIGATALAVPFTLLATLSPAPLPAVLGLCGIVFLLAVPVSMGPFVVQTTTPNEFRGVAISVYLLIVNIIGLGLGPLLVALISDRVLQNDRMIGQSVALLAAVGLPIAAAFFFVAQRGDNRTDRPSARIVNETLS